MASQGALDEVLMLNAYEWASLGTCGRIQVGCVFAQDDRSVASGYNGAPKGMPHCACTPEDYRRRDEIGPCLIASHAESNTIAWAARTGAVLLGSTCYTTLSPCLNCAHLIVNAGASRVVMDRLYPDTSGVEFLANAGVNVHTLGLIPSKNRR